MRTTRTDLYTMERYVNELTRKVNLRVSRRYNYYAIDVTNKNGGVIDTLEAGLSAKQAFIILRSIHKLLQLE